MSASEGDVRSECLVEPAWVESHLSDVNLVIVDIDAEAGYRRGHVPGAVTLHPDYERDSETGWVSTMPPDRFAEVCRSLGIGDDTLVVVYDNNMSLPASRLWWVLRLHGHANVKVMDGGWRTWLQERRAVSFESPTPKADVTFTPRRDDTMLGALDDVKAACGLDSAVIWDVRTEGEYDGSVNRGNNNRAGHIAGAVHVEWSDLMHANTHRFKPDEEMRTILNAKGITPDKTAYAY